MANEQVSVLLKFTKQDGPLLEAQKQLNGFFRTIEDGFKLNLGFKFADALLEIPGRLREGIKAAQEYGESVTNMATQTRMTTSSFQVFSLMAAQSGIEVTKLTAAVQKMSMAASRALNGIKLDAVAFSDLGINAKEFSALSAPMQFEALAKAAASAGWSTAALNDLSQILGTRNLPQLLVILHRVAEEGFQGMADAATKAGAVASDSVIKHLAEISEKQKETAQIWKKTWSDIGDSVGDAMDRLSRKTAGTLDGIMKQIDFIKADKVGRGFFSSVDSKDGISDPAAHEKAMAAYRAKYDVKVDVGTGNGAAVKNSDTLEKEATAAAKVAAEVEKLRAKYEELSAAALPPAEKLIQLQKDLMAAEKASFDAIQKSSNPSNDPAVLKLAIARQELAVKVEAAQKEVERNEKEKKHAAEQLAHAERLKAIGVIEAQEITLKEKAAELDKKRFEIEQSHDIDTLSKTEKLREGAVEYKKIVQQIVDLETKRLALAKDPVELARLQAEIARLKSQMADYGHREADKHVSREQQSADALADSRDTNKHFQSARSGVVGGLEGVLSKASTIGDHLAASIGSIAQSLTGSIASGIEGLINRTLTWGQAFRNIGSTIIQSVVASFAKMVAEWAVSRLAIFALNKIFAVKDAAATATQATAAASAWAPAATAASIASFGVAAGTGVAAFLAAMAIGTAGAAAMAGVGGVAGFSEGGHTGPGGIVHANEWVAPSWMVGDPMLGQVISGLEGMRTSSNRSLTGGGVSRFASSSGGGKTNVFFSDDRQAINRSMRQTKGQNTIVQIMRNGRGEFFA